MIISHDHSTHKFPYKHWSRYDTDKKRPTVFIHLEETNSKKKCETPKDFTGQRQIQAPLAEVEEQNHESQTERLFSGKYDRNRTL